MNNNRPQRGRQPLPPIPQPVFANNIHLVNNPELDAPIFPPHHPEYDNLKLQSYINFVRSCIYHGINLNRINELFHGLNPVYLGRALEHIRNNQVGGYKKQPNQWTLFVQDNFKREKAYLESQLGGNGNVKIGDVMKSLSVKYRAL